jgi:hypothetical protein
MNENLTQSRKKKGRNLAIMLDEPKSVIEFLGCGFCGICGFA